VAVVAASDEVALRSAPGPRGRRPRPAARGSRPRRRSGRAVARASWPAWSGASVRRERR
jgi:hypothetical protein